MAYYDDDSEMDNGWISKLRPEDVRHIREWVNKQPHLPPGITEDQIKMFIHSCYYRLENAKKAIETYYTLRSNTPEFFANRNLSNPGLQHMLNVCRICMLPRTTPRGYHVLFGHLAITEPSQFYLDDAIKLLFLTIDSHVRDHGLSAGIVFLFDMTGVSFGHLTRINLASARKFFTYIQEAMPVRLKSIHIMNVNHVMTHVMNLIRPFIQKQHLQFQAAVDDMLHLHAPEQTEELYQYVPREILPKDYNGEEASVVTLTKITVDSIQAKADWFRLDEAMRTDETKRRGQSQDISSIQGVFKRLDID